MEQRRVTPEDAADIYALLLASDQEVLGFSDYTMTELEGDLRRSGVVSLGWYDGAGSLAAYGWFELAGDGTKLEIDAYVRPDLDRSLGVEVVRELERQGLERAAAAGGGEVVLDTAAYRQDDRTQWWLAECGLAKGTTFTRMRIDVDPAAPPPEPEPPAGVVVTGPDGAEDRLRTAYRIEEESFAEHYGHVARTYEQWRERYDEHGWSQLWLAHVDGEPAGALVGTGQFVESDDAGYVRTLGVLGAARGRGVAKTLLRTYFAAAARAGRTAVLLHVDVGNVTGALALYESVGMRPVLRLDAFAKRVPVPAGG